MRRFFGPIRVRLALIVMIAAVPLLMLSATIAWQNFQLARNATVQAVERLRESATSRELTAITGARQMLQALAQISEIASMTPQACSERLAGILQLQAEHYSNIGLSMPDGSLRCAAHPVAPARLLAAAQMDRTLFDRARDHRDLVLGPIRFSPLAGLDVIPAAYPVFSGSTLTGYLYASLRIDWFIQAAGTPLPELRAVWIADATGLVATVSDPDHAIPPNRVMAALEATPSVNDTNSAVGAPYAYASARLTDGYTLIVAYPARLDRAAAFDLLIRRLGQLCLLLMLGLAAVAIGTHLALVEPLTQLSRSVAAWRVGGRFDPSLKSDPPTEIASLAASFREATNSLADHAEKLRQAAEQQELLMREIHHRVKNNLQIVASLLNLQASRIRAPEARTEFASARDRVRALATLHRHLYMQGEVHTIDMPAFLTELCGQLFQAMGETAGERIHLRIEASPLRMNSDQAVPLSLIVTEAVSNAVKYAFPQGRRGNVQVRLTTRDDIAELMIEDDGVGIPAGKTETETGPRDGIGITLIRGFVRQLRATLTVQEDHGTRYVVQIPLLAHGGVDAGE